MIYRVLFVCTGNICRSPTAHAVFRAKVEDAGLSDTIHVASAGTQGYHIGEKPDPRSITTALRRGNIDMNDLRARRFSKNDFAEFDLILAMDEGNLDFISNINPGNGAEVRMFMGRSVPDPYYADQRAFDNVYDMIEQGADVLLEDIQKKLKN